MGAAVAARLVLRRVRTPRRARCTRCAGTSTTSRRCCASASRMHSRRKCTLHFQLRIYCNYGHVHAVWCVKLLRAYQLACDKKAATGERNRARRDRTHYLSKSRHRPRGPGAAWFRQRTYRPTLIPRSLSVNTARLLGRCAPQPATHRSSSSLYLRSHSWWERLLA